MKLSGVESKRTISKFGKENFCHVFTYFINSFHVAVVQRRIRNEQKSMMHVQSCCFSSCFFAILVAIPIVLALAPCSCDPEILQLW